MGEFVQELFRFGLYKRNQGRIARQVTFAGLAVIVALAAWSLNQHYSGGIEVTTDATGAAAAMGSNFIGRYVVPTAVLLGGWWAAFRMVQMPNFAEFLISVENEMGKVSWPTRSELFRASIVVILMIFILAMILFAYDLVWRFLLERVLHLK